MITCLHESWHVILSPTASALRRVLHTGCVSGYAFIHAFDNANKSSHIAVQKGMSWPSQAMKRPLSSIETPSMMPSSCATARSRVNSFSGLTFCNRQLPSIGGYFGGAQDKGHVIGKHGASCAWTSACSSGSHHALSHYLQGDPSQLYLLEGERQVCVHSARVQAHHRDGLLPPRKLHGHALGQLVLRALARPGHAITLLSHVCMRTCIPYRPSQSNNLVGISHEDGICAVSSCYERYRKAARAPVRVPATKAVVTDAAYPGAEVGDHRRPLPGT